MIVLIAPYNARYFLQSFEIRRKWIARVSDNICSYVLRVYKATPPFIANRLPISSRKDRRWQANIVSFDAYSGSSFVITLCIRTVMYRTMKRADSEFIGVDNDNIFLSRRRSHSSFSFSSSLLHPRPSHPSADWHIHQRQLYFRASLMHARNWRGGKRNARLVVHATDERAGKAQFAVIC